MNYIQLIIMWIGILIMFLVINSTGSHYFGDNDVDWLIWTFMVALITAALIFTTRKIRAGLNYKKGFFRLACVLTLLSFLFSIFFLMSDLHDDDDLLFSVLSIPLFLWLPYTIIFYVVIPVAKWIRKGFNETNVQHDKQEIKNVSAEKSNSLKLNHLEICKRCGATIGKLQHCYEINSEVVCAKCYNTTQPDTI